ncbi:MAG TPA: hypothetical protein VMV17_21845 [Streptosporangiaceae bacterium]|nr:hypothetical protein [Streptosporangiaceae bacterium]
MAAFAIGYSTASGHVTVRTVTRTVVKTAPPVTVTRWRTRVVHRTRTVPGPAGVDCGVADGLPYPPDSGIMSYLTTCAVSWRVSTPAALGTDLVLTDPAGQSNSWSLTLAGQ